MGEKEGQEIGFYVNGKPVGKPTDTKVELCSNEDKTFQKVYDIKGYNVTFEVQATEDATNFFQCLLEEHKSAESAFKARIKHLFGVFVNLNSELTDKDRRALYQLFELGYSLGWNDCKTLIEKNYEIQDGRQD